MTLRLYYTDAYLRDFEADVVDRADEGRRVYLDRTAFYPTSGGQPFDLGTLGGVDVVDVVDEGDRVAHLLTSPVPAGRVRGVVAWERRFDHMQQHTGQHLLSAVLHEQLGHETVSVHFGKDVSTLDLDVSAVDHAHLVEAERRANRIVTENRPVTVTFEDAGSAGGLRRTSSREGTLRIVTIDDLDRSACGGTHVRATGEIGAIAIRRVERVKHHARVEFLCGERAMRRARADHELLSRLAGLFSASADELPALVEAQRTELKEAAAARRELETSLSEVQSPRPARGGGARCWRSAIDRAAGGGAHRSAAAAGAGAGRPAPVGLRRMDDRAARGPGSPAQPIPVWTRDPSCAPRWRRWVAAAAGTRGWHKEPPPPRRRWRRRWRRSSPAGSSPARTRAPRPTWCRARCRTDPGGWRSLRCSAGLGGRAGRR